MSHNGVWEPNPAKIKPDAHLLKTLLEKPWPDAQSLDQLNDISRGHLQRWIALPEAQWQELLDVLTPTELLHLIQLFTLAEQHLANCHAGAQSVVIPAFKRYRTQLGHADSELLRWLRQHSDNRFLPYGSANL